jgi:hypothetical protein
VVAIDPMILARQQLDDAVGEAMTKFAVKQREEMPGAALRANIAATWNALARRPLARHGVRTRVPLRHYSGSSETTLDAYCSEADPLEIPTNPC